MAGLAALANQRIPIAQALRWASVTASEGDSRKLDCPFALVSHPDGGAERALRIYDDNMAWCFACGRGWTPVRLMSEYWDCTSAEAAEKMLKLAGITPPSWRERWEELHQPAEPDRASLAEALKSWCRRIAGPDWDRLQFLPEVAVPLSDCLGLLPLVRTDREAREYLDGCKLIMGGILHGRGEAR